MPWPSALARGRLVGPHKVRRPVGFPGLVVVGEGLLPPCMIVIFQVPGIPDLYRPSDVFVLTIESTVLALKTTEYGRLDLSAGTAHPVDRPLMLGEIKGAERET